MAYLRAMLFCQFTVGISPGAEEFLKRKVGVCNIIAVVNNALPVHLAEADTERGGKSKSNHVSFYDSPRFFLYSLVLFRRLTAARSAAAELTERLRTLCDSAPGAQTSTQ